MRLKTIKLAGFKSFVDPTSVHFPSNLAAVVGPNGCGKSNIIDAVRWVMGESSAKNLRGESMTDVIFNGSINRKPVGQASIELVFDNSDGKLGGEYASFTDIALRRRVTREGQSEYFLNGSKCRRRDITDIFLGTGLGPRSYAIIEQGMISRLIEAKPEELRIFIEEAAGISKYKERRRETENRMRRTKENLERLTDLRDELERQLSHLQRQAQAAERYTELKKEERRLKAELAALQWQGLDRLVGDGDGVIRELELQQEAIVTERVALETQIEQFRDKHATLNDQFNEVQGRFYSIGAEIARTEQSIQHMKERQQQLMQDLQQAEAGLAETKRHLESDGERAEQVRIELEEVEPLLEESSMKEEETAAMLLQSEERMQDWQQRWDDFNQRASEPRRQAEVQQSRIQHLETSLQRLQQRQQKQQQEINDLDLDGGEDESQLMQEELAELEMQGESQRETLENLAGDIGERREQLEELSSDLDLKRSQLQQLRGRKASLEALQQAAQADAGDAPAQWLADQGLAEAPRLMSQLAVDAGWDVAVETVLGSHLQAVAVDVLDKLAEAASGLEQGALVLVDQHAEVSAAADSLAARVKGPSALTAPLCAVKTAASLSDALAMRSGLAEHESVITAEGVWLSAAWLRVYRAKDATAGSLAREQELNALNVQLDQLEADVDEAQTERQSLQEQLRGQESQRDVLQRDAQQHNRRFSEISAQLSARSAKLEQMQERRRSLEAELADTKKQYQQEQETLAAARMELQGAIESMEQDSGEREKLLRERDDSRAHLDEARQRARHDKDHAHQLAMRKQSLQSQLDSAMQAIERAKGQAEQFEMRREDLLRQQMESGDPLPAQSDELEAMLERRVAVEEELAEARRQRDEVDHELRQTEQQRQNIENRLQSVRSELEKARLANQELQVRRRTLEEQLQAAEQTAAELLESLDASATEADWQEKLEAVGRRIARLGAINLAAIDEYKQQSERKNYLDAQNNDLEEALATLENAIRRIDKETRNRFKETFEKINSGLQELFPKVFGGGSASLALTGEDLLDTGVAIMARPPGKKNSTIHLLSGGEKALTAIALVFSIFRLNPAPFCMLDEVDAPLDDANVGRYARMVKEMSDQVQFIFITHNKIAMEMAEQLMGVTMHEPGVSRLVSVDLEEAAEMVEA